MTEPRESTAKWAVRKPDGTVLRFPNLDVLQSWIRDGIVVKGDWIEHEEAGWTRVEAVTELAVMMAKSTPATKPVPGPRLAAGLDDDETAEALTEGETGPPPLPFPSAASPAPEPAMVRTRKMTRAKPPATAGEQTPTSNVISLTDVERPSLSREEIESDGESVLGAVVPPALPSDAGAEVLLPLTPGTRPRGSSPRTGPMSSRPATARREASRADIELQRALIRRGRAAKLRRRALLGVAFVGGLAGLTVWALSQRGDTGDTVEGRADETVAARPHASGEEAAGGQGVAPAMVGEGAEGAGSPAGSEIEASAPRAADRQEPSPVAAATGDAAREGAPAAAGAGQYVSPEELAKAKAEAAERASAQASALVEAQAEAARQGAHAKVSEVEQARLEAAAKRAEIQAAHAAAAAKQAADAEAAKQAADAEAAKQVADAEAAKRAAAAKQVADAEAAKRAAAAKQVADAEAAKRAAAAKQAADAEVAKRAAAAKKAADAEAAKRAAAAKKAADAAAAKKAADAAAAKKAADAAAAKKAVAPPAPAKAEPEPATRDLASLMAAGKKLEKGKPVEALRLYREALAMSPSNTDVLMAMGRTQIALANMAGAEAYLRKCRSISASHSGCLYWLGRTLAMTGKSAEANQLFHEYLSRNPDGGLADDVRKRLGQ